MIEADSIREALSLDDIATVRALLREYAEHLSESVGGEHICLDSYEAELAALPGPYAPPRGVLLLAEAAGEPAGCVALKPLKPVRAVVAGEAACEMKRLWVRPGFRGRDLGLKLARELMSRAASLGYTAMYLDTMPGTMAAANRVYQSLGFREVERYADNPVLRKQVGWEGNSSPEVVFFRAALG